ncbi:MAG: hypothetical protein AB7P02_11915 [Alphaproteobacteria bacterium]
MVLVECAALATSDGTIAGQTPSYGIPTMAISTSTVAEMYCPSMDVPDPVVDGRSYVIEFAVGDVFWIAERS